MKQLGVRVKGEESERGGSNLKVTQSDNAGTQVRIQNIVLNFNLGHQYILSLDKGVFLYEVRCRYITISKVLHK